MKRLISLLLILALMASLGSIGASADELLDESALFTPGESSDTGELSVDWAPESLDKNAYGFVSAPMLLSSPQEEAADAAAEDGDSDGEKAEDGEDPSPYEPNYEDGSCFDPRRDGTLSLPIRDQGSEATCWSTAAMACAELNGLKTGLLSGTPNLSEWHLEYFARKGFVDTLGNTGRDHHTEKVLRGGNPYLSVMTLACWVGPADETDTGTPYEELDARTELPDEIAMADEMHLENAYWLAMAGPEDWAVLKEQIQSQGSAVLCFNYDPSCYNAEHFSYYNPNAASSTNHEVTVVGWDDNFPASYFTETPIDPATGAPAAGAWLCRNSLGDGWGDGGYFWLSYYDGVLRSSTAAVFDFGSADNYDNNYQYDGCAVYTHVLQSNVTGYANVFTAAANEGGYEQLQAVSTYSYCPGVEYTVSVYTDLADLSEPDSGLLAASARGVFDYAGFHTVKLDTPVDLYEGQIFAVVFQVSAQVWTDSETGEEKTAVSIPTCSTNSAWASVNSCTEGESFVLFASGNWTDISLAKGSNVRIKAYTVNKEKDLSISLDPNGGSLPEGSSSVTLAWGQAPGDTLPIPTREDYDFTGWYNSRGELLDSDERLFGDVSLLAHWLKSWGEPFTDVIADDWYYGEVKYCYQNGLINGMSDTLFGEAEYATRGDIVTLLYRLSGEPTISGSLPFDDVDADKYYADAVLWASQEEIVQGSDDDGDGVFSFRPRAYVTRQEFIVMLYRYAKWSGMDTTEFEESSLKDFGDTGSISEWALTAEKWSVGAGLQNGDGGKLYPRDNIFRREVAALLARFDGYTET